MPVPDRFARTEATQGTEDVSKGSDAEFWTVFGDPRLSALIEKALALNNDLRGAMARYDRERALLREAKFDRYPTVTAGAQFGHEELSEVQAFGYPRNADIYSVSANASWETGLFGRVHRNIEAHRADSAAQADDLRALQVSIVSDVANAYVDLRGTQERLRVARENADNQRETLKIVNARLNAGRGSDFDVSRARAQFEATLSHIPFFEAQIAVDEHRIAVLTGSMPETSISELDAPTALPSLPARIDPGTPGEVLRKRPDVAAAEERLHASVARVGIATADLFPHVNLNGLIGTFAFTTDTLFKPESQTSLLTLGIDWSFLDVGRVRARIAASSADANELLAHYQQTVIVALEETENALARYSRARTEDEHLERAAADSANAAKLAREQLRVGAIGIYETLDAERVQLQAQDAFADGRTRSAIAAVALYRALAGGWPQRLPTREGS
jgi:NodT family efflux transporter outer membrane factor (OMF) lipoprotein